MYFCAFSVCPYLHSVSGKQTGSKSLRGTCALRLSLRCQTSQTDFRDVNIVHAKDILQFPIVPIPWPGPCRAYIYSPQGS